jgi:hypothetical protein
MQMKLLHNNVNLKEFEILVDSNLEEMFNPKINVSNQFKEKVKQTTIKDTDKGLDIIKSYIETREYVDVDCLLNKIDTFMSHLKELLSNISDKYEAISVGTIWNSFFGQLQSEAPKVDKNIFIYAENQLLDILSDRMKK